MRAFAIARAMRNPFVSSDRQPSIPIETTTNCAFRFGSRNSGQLFCFFRWAICSATPFRRTTFGAKRKTKWCPPQLVRHLGLVNRPRRLQVCVFRLRCWDVYRPFASLQMRAMMLLRIHPRLRVTCPLVDTPRGSDLPVFGGRQGQNPSFFRKKGKSVVFSLRV